MAIYDVKFTTLKKDKIKDKKEENGGSQPCFFINKFSLICKPLNIIFDKNNSFSIPMTKWADLVNKTRFGSYHSKWTAIATAESGWSTQVVVVNRLNISNNINLLKLKLA